MLKLLIAEGSEEFRQALAEKLMGAYLIRVCVEGKDALETMRSFRPDLMVLDLMLPGLDGVSLLQRASDEEDPPTVLSVSCFFNDYILEALTRLNVGYVMKKPCDIDANRRLRPQKTATTRRTPAWTQCRTKTSVSARSSKRTSQSPLPENVASVQTSTVGIPCRQISSTASAGGVAMTARS